MYLICLKQQRFPSKKLRNNPQSYAAERSLKLHEYLMNIFIKSVQLWLIAPRHIESHLEERNYFKKKYIKITLKSWVFYIKWRSIQSRKKTLLSKSDMIYLIH